MDRCALFVDAGYALSDGALAVHGTRHRDSVSWDYAGLLKLLAELARDRTGLPVLRCYWYEATVDSRRTSEHETLADIPGVKLRLGKVRPGRREGVETEIRRDLTALARNKAVTDVLIVSAEEDLSQVISDVQDQGIKVAILHISGDGDETASRALRQECDDVIEISAQHLRPYVDLIPGAEPAVRDDAASRYAASTVSGGNVSGGNVSSGAVAGGGSIGTPQRGPATAAASSSMYPAPVAADYSRVSPPGGAVPSANEPAAQGSGSPMAGTPAMASSGDNGARGNGTGALGSGNMGSGNMGSGGQPGQDLGRGMLPGSDGSDVGRQGGPAALSRPDDQSSRLPAHQQYQGSDAMRGPGPQGQLNSPGQPGPGQSSLPPGGMTQPGLGGNGLGGNGLGQGPLPPSGPPTGPQSGLPLGGPQQNGPGRGGLPPQGPADIGHGGATSQPSLGGFPPNGLPQNGLPGNGMPGNGLSHLGLPPGGMPQNGLPQNGLPGNGMPPGGMPQNGMGQNGMPGNGMPGNGLPQNGMSQNGLSGNGLPGNGLPQNGLPGNGLPPSGFGQHSLPSGSAGELPRGGGLGQHAQSGPPQHSQSGPPPQNGLPPGASSGGPAALERPAPLDRPPALPPPRQLPPGPGAGPQYQPGVNAPYGGQSQQPPAAPPGQYGGGYGSTVPPGSSYPAAASGPYDVQHLPASGPPSLPQSSMPQPIAISLADAVQAAHAEGFGFGEAVARDAPALWLEAVLARKPRMPSDLEARLLQGSALPIDSLLHDEVRHALRRGFWDALERSRR